MKITKTNHTTFWELISQNICYLWLNCLKIVNLSILTSYDVIINVIICIFFKNIHKICNIWPKYDHHTPFWEFIPQNMWSLCWVYVKIVNLSIFTSHDVIIDEGERSHHMWRHKIWKKKMAKLQFLDNIYVLIVDFSRNHRFYHINNAKKEYVYKKLMNFMQLLQPKNKRTGIVEYR